MPAATAVIVFGSWLVLLGLTLWAGWRGRREPEAGDE
jgi:hypothetical protein